MSVSADLCVFTTQQQHCDISRVQLGSHSNYSRLLMWPKNCSVCLFNQDEIYAGVSFVSLVCPHKTCSYTENPDTLFFE